MDAPEERAAQALFQAAMQAAGVTADEADLEVVVEKCIKVAHKVLRIS